MYTRDETKVVHIGNVAIGGGNPIRVQSMCNTHTADVRATVGQILQLEEAGCELVRVTVPDQDSADALTEIKKQIHIPLIADIHFDWRMAVEAMKHGADKIRINPGNIGTKEDLSKVIDEAKARQIPIRVGVNSGSVEKDLLDKYGVCSRSLAESALRSVDYVESLGYDNLVVAIKASNVPLCVEANEVFARYSDHPLHIGITEAGTYHDGTIKSALGFGILLHEKLGNTMRVSLTADPVEEVKAAWKMLSFMNIRKQGVEIISCPTCGRTQIDLIPLAEQVEKALAHIKKPLKVAVMGCIVNGPGEARECDFGIAGGKGVGLLFRKGQIIKKVPEDQLLSALVEEAERYE
jgi:(E)-4-hydroxy-3-methylbut-2-enyl-diphosphate synthase